MLPSPTKPSEDQSDMLGPDVQLELSRLRNLSGTPLLFVHFERQNGEQRTMVYSDTAESTRPVPQHSRDATADELEKIWPIASYSKLFINLAWARLVHEPELASSSRGLELKWTTKVNQIWSHFRKNGDPELSEPLPGRPNLLELLCHVDGIAEMNRYLLAPDGRCISTKEEVLHNAPQLTSHQRGRSHGDRGWYEYSNGNHILAGILLEMVMREPLEDIMDRLVFAKFGMANTFMGRDLRSEEQHRLVSGFHISSGGDGRQTRSPSYGDSVGKYVFAAFSTLADLARFNRLILAATHGHCEDFLSTEVTSHFFAEKLRVSRDGKSISPTLGGEYFSLGPDVVVPRSINHHLVQPHSPKSSVNYRHQGKAFHVHRAVGYLDGYFATVYFAGHHDCFLIVLGNASSHFNAADYAAHLVLQESFRLRPKMDLAVAHEESRKAKENLKALEQQDILRGSANTDFSAIAGEFKSEQYEQYFRIGRDGSICICGSTFSSEPFQLIRLNSKRVQIASGANHFGIETWSCWRDRDYHIEETAEALFLVDTKGFKYKRLNADHVSEDCKQ